MPASDSPATDSSKQIADIDSSLEGIATLRQNSADKKPIHVHRLWLDRNKFIFVDDEGYPLGRFAEGAFGAVVSVFNGSTAQHTQNPDHVLKLPRLNASTLEENYYIDAMLASEAKIVTSYKQLPDKIGLLLSPGDEGRQLTYGGRETSFCLDPDAQKMDRGFIAVSYTNQRKPCLGIVKLDPSGNSITAWPPKLAKQIEKASDPDLSRLKEIIKKSKEARSPESASGNEYGVPFCVAAYTGRKSDNRTHGLLLDSLNGDDPSLDDDESPWYFGVSSLLLPWADGTLQQQLKGSGPVTGWAADRQLRLLSTLLHGIKRLHETGNVHGDIRPANIMYQGDASQPKNYMLTDFGSLAGEQLFFSKNEQNPTNETLVTPQLSPSRISVFYAPERSNASEREFGDVATIDFLSNKLVIRIRWKHEKVQAKRPDAKFFVTSSVEIEGYTQLGNLKLGDRVRIRDYVFDIEHAWANAHEAVFVTRGIRYATVLYDKIGVIKKANDETFRDIELVISRITLLPAWSAGADFFSLGTLLADTLFYRGCRAGSPNGADGVEKPNATLLQRLEELNKWSDEQIEKEFEALHAALRQPTYFSEFWPQLDLFVRKVKYEMENNVGPDYRLPEKIYPLDEGVTKTRSLGEKDEASPNQPRSYYRMAHKLSSEIVQTAKNADVLWLACEGNPVLFLAMIHLILGQMHYRLSPLLENLVKLKEGEESWAEDLPVVKDRTDPPDKDGCGKVLSWVEFWEKSLTQARFKPFDYSNRVNILTFQELTELAIAQFNPKSDYLVRIDLARVMDARDALKETRDALKKSKKLWIIYLSSAIAVLSLFIVVNRIADWSDRKTLVNTNTSLSSEKKTLEESNERLIEDKKELLKGTATFNKEKGDFEEIRNKLVEENKLLNVAVSELMQQHEPRVLKRVDDNNALFTLTLDQFNDETFRSIAAVELGLIAKHWKYKSVIVDAPPTSKSSAIQVVEKMLTIAKRASGAAPGEPLGGLQLINASNTQKPEHITFQFRL